MIWRAAHNRLILVLVELDLLLTDLSRLADRAENLGRHFAQTSTDIDQLQTSVRKISTRSEKLRDMDFGEN